MKHIDVTIAKKHIDVAVLKKQIDVVVTKKHINVTIVKRHSIQVIIHRTGSAGQGIPTGGLTGQILKKIDDTNFNTEWSDGGADGHTPYIQNTHWYIDGIDTGVVAIGTNGASGNDGYTPQKGVDYFDGAPGMPGEPGYTPQKGVDYFDGSNGLNGIDGKDGNTPYIQNEYWYINNVNTGIKAIGTKGDNGNDGYTPVKNVDYFDGNPGTPGEPGYTPQKNVDYFDGDKGLKGDKGDSGVGIATGGTTNQVLKKNSNTDYDTIWGDGANALVIVSPDEPAGVPVGTLWLDTDATPSPSSYTLPIGKDMMRQNSSILRPVGKPIKHVGNPVIEITEYWESGQIVQPAPIVTPADTLRIYYISAFTVCMTETSDGTTFVKHEGAILDSSNFTNGMTYVTNVYGFYDFAEPDANKKYKMWVIGYTGGWSELLPPTLITSPNGIDTWTERGQTTGWDTAGANHDANSMFRDGNTYVALCPSLADYGILGIARSDDGINFGNYAWKQILAPGTGGDFDYYTYFATTVNILGNWICVYTGQPNGSAEVKIGLSMGDKYASTLFTKDPANPVIVATETWELEGAGGVVNPRFAYWRNRIYIAYGNNNQTAVGLIYWEVSV